LNDDETAALLILIPFLRTWADTLESHALSILLHGGELPGFKLVSGRMNRTWSDEQLVAQWLSYETSTNEAMPRVLVSPAQAEKLLRSHGLENWKTLVAEYTVRGTGQPTIASEKDPRPSIEPFGEFQLADETGDVAELME
jgi:hypothetical protein